MTSRRYRCRPIRAGRPNYIEQAARQSRRDRPAFVTAEAAFAISLATPAPIVTIAETHTRTRNTASYGERVGARRPALQPVQVLTINLAADRLTGSRSSPSRPYPKR